MTSSDWKKYLWVFVITATVFGTVLYISTTANDKRLAEIKAIEDKIAVDILSSETEYSLLSESACSDVNNPSFTEELNSLAEKLSYTEERSGSSNPDVISLKRYYSLLQIKDYLLTKKIGEKCGKKPLVILYFYSNAGDCDDCERMGYVLTFLRNEYPELRVYAFDYHLELSALRTLTNILKVKEQFPAVVVNGTVHYGFRNIEQFETLIPELKVLKAAQEKTKGATTTSPATSTNR